MTVSFVCAIGPSICMETEANPDNPACVCEQEQKERVPSSFVLIVRAPSLVTRASRIVRRSPDAQSPLHGSLPSLPICVPVPPPGDPSAGRAGAA